MQTDDTTLRYPIGKFVQPDVVSKDDISRWITVMSGFPAILRDEVEGLTEEELSHRYRKGGWTVRQVVHHLADSHVNCYVRFKLALTEDIPVIKPYVESLWAELPDSAGPVDVSLDMISSVHARLVSLLKCMTPDQFSRKYYHPESKREWELGAALGMYAWHCDHHLAHIRQALKATA
jgi:hypothetical protein